MTATALPANKLMPSTPPPRHRQSTAVAKIAPAPVVEALSFDQQILRAASDPNIDVTKLRQLTELRREMRMEAAEQAFNEAMVQCQHEMRPIQTDAKNDQTHSKYATLYAVDKALRPIYSKHGFALSFNTADSPLPNHLRVLCYVSRGMFTRTYQHDVAISMKGPKGNDLMTPTHAGGSALSYGKRYLELMIFNVTIGDPGRPIDDDGNAAGGEPIAKDGAKACISSAQAAHLNKLIDDIGGDKIMLCNSLKVGSVPEIPASQYEHVLRTIANKAAKKLAAQTGQSS